MYMKKLFAMCALMLASVASGRADSGWLLVTDSGVRIPMESVGMLVAGDDAKTFSVVRTTGAGDAVSGVTSVSFAYDPASSGIGEIGVEGIGILPDPVTSSVMLMGCKGRQMSICDMGGRVYVSAVVTADSERVDVSGLSAGMYVLRAGEASVKFIKK